MRSSGPGTEALALGLALFIASVVPAQAGAAGPAPSKAAAAAQPTPADSRSAGHNNCRFEKPDMWTEGKITWLGACRSGFADGYGVILNEIEGSPAERFFGRLNRGYLRLGALQSESGYMAGRWTRGGLAPAREDDQAARNELIAAFDAAAKAASSVSRSLSRQGNAASSRFYAEQARMLRTQMD